ncbi:MAG: DNA translocase FtsK, partial [Roseiflexaceae bacterium]|nr:DNA translocase FtsK [Roseiflexaceae bacterium]
KAFRDCLPAGDFTLEISGHAWMFCYDSSLGITSLSDEGDADVIAPDAKHVPHRYHHFGRTGLRRLLRSLVEAWELPAPVETWSAAHDSSPASTALKPTELPQTTASTGTEPTVSFESMSPKGESAPSSQPLAEWCKQQAGNLVRALNNYGIQVYPIQADEADIGPGVVRFKIRLRPGEKLSRLQSIASDLQRELALMAPPLIDNVRGTNFVGIDLPHPQPQTLLLLPELSNLPHPAVSRLPFLVGKTPDGRLITADLADLPHLLVAGSTGSGKTIFLYSLLLSLIHHHSPNELLMLLIDPKQTDFVYFDDLPHLLGGKVVIDPYDSIKWLDHLATDMLNHRSQQLRNARCRDIHDYNSRHQGALIAPLVVVIDEYADLIQVLNKSDRQSFEQRLVRLAQRARNVGIHLVIATQRPSADIVTTSLKTNLPARVAFRLPSHHDSMIILDRPGAENLLGRGDMLFANQQYVERLQGFYVSSSDLEQYLQNVVNASK